MGNGGLTPSVLVAAEEWLAFNASVRRAGEQKGRLSFTSRGGLERGGDDSPCSRVGSLPSSDAEMWGVVEGLDWCPQARWKSPHGSEGGCEWAACLASLSPFLSSRLEGGCRILWARLPYMCLRF